MKAERRDPVLVPLHEYDLVVLSWYAEWAPEVHRAKWSDRRRLPPGFRYMQDLSVPGFSDRNNTVLKAKAEMSAGPVLGEEKDDVRSARRIAHQRISRLLKYRLIEGSSKSYCRLTARGRAALKLHGLKCPDAFESHCSEVFDEHSLLPVNGENARIDFDDRTMRRLGDEYRVGHGSPLPDNETTWRLMLSEYSEDDYKGRHTFTGATARISTVSSTGTHLNGSLRAHQHFVSLAVEDDDLGLLLEVSMSFEQLASLLVSGSSTPVTIDRCTGRDGVFYSKPAPPPVSVSRRMKERIGRGTEDLANRIEAIRVAVEAASMGKRAQAELLKELSILSDAVKGHGSFAAQQAMEEMSSVAEGLTLLVAETAAVSGLGAPVVGLLANRLDGGSDE